MTVVKYEQVTLNSVVRTIDVNGETSIAATPLFDTVVQIVDLKNPLKLQEHYRLYTSFAHFIANYTPALYAAAQEVSSYSFNWRNFEWRIVDAVENGTDSITFLAYDASPYVNI